jgi:hypothetical protein
MPPKRKSYSLRVKEVRETHPYGDKVTPIMIKDRQYDWDGINLKDAYGEKVGELRDRKLLEQWFSGAIHKYNVPENPTKFKTTEQIFQLEGINY